MYTVLVTGASGFVGRAVTAELSKQGARVYAIVRKSSQRLEELKKLSGVTLLFCDMSEYVVTLPVLLKKEHFDVCYHFAWQGSSGPERANEKVQLENVRTSCDLLRAVHDLGCKRFIFAASIMEYEATAFMHANREVPSSVIYSTAKLTANYMLHVLANQLEMEYIPAVISNIYGPGETAPRLINSSLRKMTEGQHVSFSAGNQIYDFIYILDAAKMFVALGNKGKPNTVYYIGSGAPRPLKEFLIQMGNITASEIGLGEIPFMGVSLSYQEFDVHACERDTGVRCQVSFEDGIRRTLEWINNNK